MSLSLDAKIESILFWKAESISSKNLSKLLEVQESEVIESIEILKQKLSDRGFQILENDGEYQLVTHSEMSDILSELNRQELSKDLSKASLETLSIIIYRGPIKRSEIDYIRGVNSQTILRMLLIRGLIEKENDPKDERTYLYKASSELLQFLGINNIKDMPEYNKVNEDIDNFLKDEPESEDKEQ